MTSRKMTAPAAGTRSLRYMALAMSALFAAGCTTSGPWPGSAPAGVRQTGRGAYQAGVQPGYYRVNAGDTLASVAAGFGQRPADIAQWNQLPATAALVPGQIIRVAPPVAPNANANRAGGQAIRFAWPAYGNVLKPGAGDTGPKRIIITGRPDDPVKAAADGTVIYVGNAIQQYAALIVVKHSNTLVTAYAVNGPVTVKEGDAVHKGQQIAQMGADPTGRASVQFEIRREGAPMDPLAYLPH